MESKNSDENNKTKKSENSKKVPRARKTKKSEKGRTRNVASQKRFVSAVKVFLNDAEKKEILAQVGNFKSVSNYIRHHLGLTPNGVGRKRRYTESALDLEMDDFGRMPKTGKSVKTEKTGKTVKAEKAKKVNEPTRSRINIEDGQPGLWNDLTR